MNQVTARKWRPRLFKDFVGQDYITYSLQQSIKESKIAHGYLFSGPRGVGKTSTARVFSMALNCLNLQVDYEPCLECKNCQEIRGGYSADVIEIDGASNRGIDDMREMRNNIQFMPSYSQYKIYIIDEVHMLTTEAFNSILKVLEEPPSYLVFLFATTEIHKVKNTIRSRCQQFYLKRLTEDQIATQLEKILTNYHISYDTEALKLLAKSADGSMRDSQSLLDQAIIFSEGRITLEKVKEILGLTSYTDIIQFFRLIISDDGRGIKEFTRSVYIGGNDLSFFLLQILQILREILLIKYNAEDLSSLPQDIKRELLVIAKHFDKYQIQSLIDLYMVSYKEMKETDNEFFLLEGVLLKTLEYKGFVNLTQLLERLSVLEKQISKTSVDSVSPPTSNKSEPMNPNNIKLVESPENNTDNKVTKVPKKPIELSVIDLFGEYKKSITEPRTMKIFLDIKTLEYKEPVLKIEFFTKEGVKKFVDYTVLYSSLKEFFHKKGYINLQIEPYVDLVNLASSDNKIDETKEQQDITNIFIDAFNATEIKGED